MEDLQNIFSKGCGLEDLAEHDSVFISKSYSTSAYFQFSLADRAKVDGSTVMRGCLTLEELVTVAAPGSELSSSGADQIDTRNR